MLIGIFTPPAASNDDDLRRAQGRFSHTGYHGALALAEDPHALAAVCPLRFPGQWQDEQTGLYYNRHRHYDPLTAQYVSPDPIGLEGGDRPQGYVERPGVWTDPLGLAARAAYQRPLPEAPANWNKARANYWREVGNVESSSASGKYSPPTYRECRKGKRR